MRDLAYRDTIDHRLPGQAHRLAKTKAVPFDYVFQLELEGKRGNKVQDVLEISIEGIFVALSLGYSLMPSEPRTTVPVIRPVPKPAAARPPIAIPFFLVPVSGTDYNRIPDGIIVVGEPGAEIALLNLSTIPPDQTRFDPSLEQINKIGADGTVKLAFPPPAVIPLIEEDPLKPPAASLLRLWDRSNNLFSQLFAVGPPATPAVGFNLATHKPLAAGDKTVLVYGSPGENVGVFLLKRQTELGDLSYVNPDQSTFTLSPISLDDGRETGLAEVMLDAPLEPEDTLLVRYKNPEPGFSAFTVPFSTFTVSHADTRSGLMLADIEAGLEKVGADLTRGFRLKPKFASLSLDQLGGDLLDQAFETCGAVEEEVSFFYSLDTGDTGREYQNKPIHSIAGLGIANGDRPFRPFAKPILFEPRSPIRIQVEEISGPPGTLFIVLQGYKILGTGRIPE